ncbi:MAG TPA: RidA family protein [Planosporangium sp.]|nr:RidA family protein [Planosporangium sp.]
MTPPDDRLSAAPVLPPPPGGRPAIAAVRRSGGTLLASGQVAVRDGRLIATGRVGAEVDLDTARACAWQCARNVLTAVREETGTLAGVEAETVIVYVASEPGFHDQHLVADAATALFDEVLGGRHARAAIGVAALPTGSPVEVRATFGLREPQAP